MPVDIVQKDILPPVAPAQDVIHRPGVFDASLTWQESESTPFDPFRQSQNDPCYG
jgi:hypothetical protein